jgi:hypothetical protein
MASAGACHQLWCAPSPHRGCGQVCPTNACAHALFCCAGLAWRDRCSLHPKSAKLATPARDSHDGSLPRATNNSASALVGCQCNRRSSSTPTCLAGRGTLVLIQRGLIDVRYAARNRSLLRLRHARLPLSSVATLWVEVVLWRPGKFYISKFCKSL